MQRAEYLISIAAFVPVDELINAFEVSAFEVSAFDVNTSCSAVPSSCSSGVVEGSAQPATETAVSASNESLRESMNHRNSKSCSFMVHSSRSRRCVHLARSAPMWAGEPVSQTTGRLLHRLRMQAGSHETQRAPNGSVPPPIERRQ